MPEIGASDSSWTTLQFRSDEDFLAVAEVESGFVAIGSLANDVSGWSSGDGLDWEMMRPWDEADGLTSWASEATRASAGFVAFGGIADLGNDGVVSAWTYSDDAGWKLSTKPPNGHVAAAAFSEQGLVAVGSSQSESGRSAGAVWTSLDGDNWVQVDDNGGVFPPGSRLTSVAAVDSGFVAVGEVRGARGTTDGRRRLAGAVWISVDGQDWLRVTDDASLWEGSRLESVIAGGPGIIAAGSMSIGGSTPMPAVWTSGDGHTWSRVENDAAFSIPGGTVVDIAAGGPGYVAIGQVPRPYDSVELVESEPGPYLWTSPDGLVWTKMPPAPQVFGPDAVVAGIAARGERVVLVGYVEADDRRTATATVWSTDAIG